MFLQLVDLDSEQSDSSKVEAGNDSSSEQDVGQEVVFIHHLGWGGANQNLNRSVEQVKQALLVPWRSKKD